MRYKRTLILWIAIYPLIMVLELVLGPFLKEMHRPLGTLIMTLVAVLIMDYILVPTLYRLFGQWLKP